MRREKIVWIISVGLVALLAFQLPGTLAQRDDDYAFVRTLIDIHRQVSANYVENVDETTLREGAIDGMLAKLDPFTVYVPPSKQESFDQMLEGSFKGVGIQLNQQPDGGPIEVVTPIDGSPAFRAGVLPGDTILKVNGESIEGMRLPEVVKKIAGKLGTEVTLTVRHPTGEEVDLKMRRAEIVVPTVRGYQRNPDNSWDYYISDDPRIGFIRVTQFTGETYDAIHSIIQKLLADDMKGLVLDLRYNPGGQLESAVKVVDMFVDSGVIVSTQGRNRPKQEIKAVVPGTLRRFPVIVLINEHSASAAEIVAGALMDHDRALVIGERSYGKGSVQELIPLEQKSGELKLTVAYYYLPKGRLVHQKKGAEDWGVKPHISVEMTDEQERKAYEDRLRQELMQGPLTRPSTQAVTQPATTSPISDIQLQRAVDAMMTWLIFGGDPEVAPRLATSLPSTQLAATTAPATGPAATRALVPRTRPATRPVTVPGE